MVLARSAAALVRACACAGFLIAFFLAAMPPAAAAERKVALVIGNGAYAQSPLPNTINDARAMTDVLGRLGFKVITRLNATQREMHHAIVEFGDELEKGGIGLFYYAGHAVQIRGKNFMIPIGSAISVEDHVEPESVDLNKVIGRMAGARNKLNVVILDACRDNPFGDTFQFYSEGLAQARAPAGTYIAYAAAPGEVAADGTGANSFYTGALVKALPEQGVSIEETFKQVRASVIKDTKGLQVPWTASSITENFFFNPEPPKVAEKAQKGADKAVDREVVFWQSIFSSTRPEDFEAYLEQFPAGNFAALARNRLADLRSRKPAAPAADKVAAMQTVPRAGTDAGLLDVIDRAMADAKTDGADYARQIQAAVEALDKIRRQREEVDRKAEAARQQVVAAVTKKAEKGFQDELAKAERDAVAAQQATLAAAVSAADEARRKALADAAEQAQKASEATAAEARKQADQAARLLLAQAEKQADEVRKRDLAVANDQAADSYRKAIADAEKAAEAMRLRMIEVARVNADKQLQSSLSDAKRAADEKAAALLAKVQKEAEAKKAKDLAALEGRIKADEAKRLEAAKQEATRKYEAAVALAKKQADAERDRILAEAKKAAEAEREAQIAKLAPTPAVKPAAAAAVSPADLGLSENIPAELRRVIDVAMADARKKGEGREGQMRAALQAIKAHRKNEAPPAEVAAAGSPVAVAVAKPELKEIIEIAMTRARSEGKSYQSQVQAALDAVKHYRDRETQGPKSPEADKSETSALLLGQSQADPELQRIIVDAMAQARAKGEDYAGQIRAALAAIKAHRARTAGAPKQ